MDDILEVTLLVAETLERLEVPYVVGESLASSFHGVPRATIDADLVAALRQEDRAAFVSALRDAFYLDDDAIRERRGHHRAEAPLVRSGRRNL